MVVHRVRTIPEYPGYLVSDTGIVWGPGRHGRPRRLKAHSLGGYLRVYVTAGDTHREGHSNRRVFVHRLVALAFHGAAPSPSHQVDHLDGDPANNHATNLEWVTGLENIRRGSARRGHTIAKLSKAHLPCNRCGERPRRPKRNRPGAYTHCLECHRELVAKACREHRARKRAAA